MGRAGRSRSQTGAARAEQAVGGQLVVDALRYPGEYVDRGTLQRVGPAARHSLSADYPTGCRAGAPKWCRASLSRLPRLSTTNSPGINRAGTESRFGLPPRTGPPAASA